MKRLLLLIAPAALCACSTTKTVYVPIETNVAHSDSLYRTTLRTDTIRERDSVTLTQRGDTVFLTKLQLRERIHNRTDTLYRTLNDTINIEKAVPIPVEKKLSVKQRIQQAIALPSLIVAAFLALLLIRLNRKNN
ncbi:MAG: hypothetical protein NC402_08445 [Prevotella sp.]|nr:hypothetical protein [Prevotella sp.]MCM1075704.1 hypothetical protein [Ruminococcus sp.]